MSSRGASQRGTRYYQGPAYREKENVGKGSNGEKRRTWSGARFSASAELDSSGRFQFHVLERRVDRVNHSGRARQEKQFRVVPFSGA